MLHATERALQQHETLVLNADFAPLTYVPLSMKPWTEAIKNVVEDTVTVVREYDIEVHSPSVTMKVPSVIAVRKYVPRRNTPSPSRACILIRDLSCCAYCGRRHADSVMTIDHVIPKAHGGKHRWENVVASCYDCNQRKRDRTPEQAGMPLQWRPWVPTYVELARSNIIMNKVKIHPSWEEFIPA